MKTLFRILGTAAVVAVTGAAIVALDKILNQKDPLHVEEVEFPDDPACRTLDRQYMFGPSMLVAPVFTYSGEVSYRFRCGCAMTA